MIDNYDERLYLLQGFSDITLQELIDSFLRNSSVPTFTNESESKQLVEERVMTRVPSRPEPSFLISLRREVYSGNGIISSGGSDEGTLEFWESSTELMRYAMMECILVNRKIVFANPIYGLTGSDIDDNLVRIIERAKSNGVVSVPTITHAYFRRINENYPAPEPNPEYLEMSSILIDFVLRKMSPPDSWQDPLHHLLTS